jgi:hypothetical protein
MLEKWNEKEAPGKNGTFSFFLSPDPIARRNEGVVLKRNEGEECHFMMAKERK